MNKGITVVSFFVLVAGALQTHAATTLYGVDYIKKISNQHPGTYRVQIGVYKNPANAQRQAKWLRTHYQYPVIISKSNNKKLSIVTVGPITVGAKGLSAQAMPTKTRPAKTIPSHTVHKESATLDKFGNSHPMTSYPVIIGFTGGAMWGTGGNNQQFYLLPDVQKAYIANRDTNTVVTGEVFAGMGFDFANNMQAQLGLAFAMNSSIGFKGDVLEDADPDFNNYNYYYKMRSARLNIKGKLLKKMTNGIAPYATASAGIAFNNAHGFKEVPKISEEVPAPYFQDNTKTSFTYALGLGIQKVLTKNWSAGIGYEYADLGRFSLSQAQGQTVNSGLSESHLSTHSALINFTFTS